MLGWQALHQLSHLPIQVTIILSIITYFRSKEEIILNIKETDRRSLWNCGRVRDINRVNDFGEDLARTT